MRIELSADDIPSPVFAAVGLVGMVWRTAESQYQRLAGDGERIVATWYAEREINRRVQRVTPVAARAAVATRQRSKRRREAAESRWQRWAAPGGGAAGEASLVGR